MSVHSAAGAKTALAGVARCVGGRVRAAVDYGGRDRRHLGRADLQPGGRERRALVRHAGAGRPGAAFEQTAFGVGWGLVNEHPPLVRVLNGLGWAVTRGVLPAPTAHRVGSMALAAFTVGVLAAATARRSGVAAGLFAAAAVVAMPRVFFHAHLGALDFAHAATWFLATLAFYYAASSRRWWAPLLAGLGLGLALLTKINAVLLVPYWGLWLLLYHRRNGRAWLVYLLSLPVALVVLVAGWPWIWANPVAGLVNWVKFFRVHFEIRQWYAGKLYVKTPWYLAPVMVGITTPVMLLALAIIGIFNRKRKPGSTAEGTGGRRRVGISDWNGLHLLGILTVVGYYMLPITAIHDQERLLLPAFLQLAVLAGGGFAVLYAWLARPMAARLRRRDAASGGSPDRCWARSGRPPPAARLPGDYRVCIPLS